MVNLRKIFKRAKIGKAAFFATLGAVAVGGVCVDFTAAQDFVTEAEAPLCTPTPEEEAPFVAPPVEDAAPIEDAEVVASPATRAGRSLAVVAKESENCGVLLVGVDKYDADKALPELRHASDDVRKLRDALTDEIGLPREAIRMFVSDGRNRERPQYAAIMKALQEILAASGPKSTVVVALSGHGFETENGDAAFCPEDVGAKFDGEKTVLNPEKAILIKDVAKALEKDDAGFKLLIVDACRNPIGKSKSASGARSFSRVADPKGVAFLQSCASGQVSYEHPDLAGGVFTHFFTEGLRGAADLDGDGGFTFNDVCDYAKSQTYRFVDDELCEEQTPFVTASFVDFWLKAPTRKSGGGTSGGSGWLPLALLTLTGGLIGFAVWAFRLQAQMKKLAATGPGPNVSGVATQSVFAPKSERIEWRKAASAASAATREREAKETALPQDYVDPAGLKFRLIQPGTFTMGNTLSPKEICKKYPGGFSFWYRDAPAHKVTLTKPFYLAKYATTVGEFKRFVDATGHQTTAERKGRAWGLDEDGNWSEIAGLNWRNPGFRQDSTHPVVCVSWEDATTYINWLNAHSEFSHELGFKPIYRLPTEAEWEYACRAGTTTEFFWGTNELADGEGYLNAADNTGKPGGGSWKYPFPFKSGYAATAPVGKFKPNDWGLYDMLGNVSEWCADRHDKKYYKKTNNAQNPKNVTKGSARVLRGGSWGSLAGICRSADRCYSGPTGRSCRYGFRLALGREL